MVHIPEVQLYFILMGEGAPSLNLSPSRKARLDFAASFLAVRPFIVLPGQQGPGTDQCHLSLQNVDQLRQFIQAVFAEEFSHLRNPRVGVVFGGKAIWIGVRPHRSKFVEGKNFAVFSHAVLAKDGRPGRRPADGQRDQGHQRRKDDQGRACGQDVDHSFQRQIDHTLDCSCKFSIIGYMIELEDIKLVVFDLDDTLYPENEFAEGGFGNVASFLAGENVPLARQLAEKMKSLARAGRRKTLFQTLLSEMHQPVTEEKISGLIRLYRTTDRPLSLFPDAERTLSRFRVRRYFLGILTDGPLESQQTKIRLLNLQSRVDRITYTAELGPGFEKPSPGGFERMMKQFNLQPRQCVYIADNEAKDFLAPNTLGWRSVKVLRPGGVYFSTAAITDSYKPQFVIETLDDLNLIP